MLNVTSQSLIVVILCLPFWKSNACVDPFTMANLAALRQALVRIGFSQAAAAHITDD